MNLLSFIGCRISAFIGRRWRIRGWTIRPLLAAVAVGIESTLTVQTLLIVEAVLSVRALLAVLTVESTLLAIKTRRKTSCSTETWATETWETSNSVTGISTSSVKWSTTESLLSVTSAAETSWIGGTKSSQSGTTELLLAAESWRWIASHSLLAVKALLVVADCRLAAVQRAGRIRWTQTPVGWKCGCSSESSYPRTETTTSTT